MAYNSIMSKPFEVLEAKYTDAAEKPVGNQVAEVIAITENLTGEVMSHTDKVLHIVNSVRKPKVADILALARDASSANKTLKATLKAHIETSEDLGIESD